MQEAIAELTAKHRKTLSEELDEAGEIPSFVQHTLDIIKRARAGSHPLYDPIVSVQPMSKPVGGIPFYKNQKSAKSKPAGADLLFEVASISALQRLLGEAAEDCIAAKGSKFLVGVAPDGQVVALFHGDDFRVINGLGVVQTGLHEVEGLISNEGYETFLLALCWRSAHGWPNELHALAVSAVDGISAREQTTKDDLR